MRMHRFILQIDLGKTEQKILDKDFIRQIKHVLRLKVGDTIVLCRQANSGEQKEAVAEITELKDSGVAVKILEMKKNTNEPERHVALYCAVLKKENFKLVCQKATEIGVKEIAPVITQRTVKLELNHSRLEKIIKEAAEQSGRTVVPILHSLQSFTEALNLAKDNEVNFFFDKEGKPFALYNNTSLLNSVGVFIGPEGGWNEDEKTLAKQHQFHIVSLGKTTLRAETAAIIASYSVLQ